MAKHDTPQPPAPAPQPQTGQTQTDKSGDAGETPKGPPPITDYASL